MGQILFGGGVTNRIGCMDSLAINYDPAATIPCSSDFTINPTVCCIYGTNIVGCMDPFAINYNPNASTNCTTCCVYDSGPFTDVLDFGDFGDIVVVGDLPDEKCTGPYQITTDGFILGVELAECCSDTSLGPPPLGQQYYWDGRDCRIIPKCPTNTTCVDCTNFNWWNNLYIANHNGQNLSTSSPIIWQQLVDLITNSGQTISVNTLNGELISEDCCKGVFRDGLCFCQEVVEETYEPKCIATLSDFLDLISTTAGYNFFINNFSTIGPSLGLTTSQINFIKLNINSTADSNSNGIQDLTEARLILSNALNVTGGFHVNFGTVTNRPILMTKSVCDQYGGFWDSTGRAPITLNQQLTDLDIVFRPNGNCMCKPVVDQCEIDLSQVKIINTYDFYNNPIQTVVLSQGNTTLSEACCNRLVRDNPNLGWVWQSPYCLASPREDCLPISFGLNEEPMEVPPCESNLELSMWVYFGKPANPCRPILDPPDNDVVIIDGEYCDITLTPNTGSIENTTNLNNIEIATDILDYEASILFSDVANLNLSLNLTGTCCYNTASPILARVVTTDPILNQFLTQVKVYNSVIDYFDRWVQIKATLPTSGLTLNFGVNLEIYQGLNCCCDYDIFVDDIRVSCNRQVPELIYNNIQCPGFNLTRVIDNKKSWVYNPGIPSVGISEYDNIERADGSFGMLNGEGTINRTFAPSLDADIPWRYTDYWQQSSVYEKHSNLVLNSKELWLTFDMCADCPISGTTLVCPDGYTLSANTQICYQEVFQKIFQDGDDFIFMDGDNYIFQ